MGFTHLQIERNPWLGGYRPQIPILSALCPQVNFLTPPPPKKTSWVRNWPPMVRLPLLYIEEFAYKESGKRKSYILKYQTRGWNHTPGAWIVIRWHFSTYLNLLIELRFLSSSQQINNELACSLFLHKRIQILSDIAIYMECVLKFK
jgi:hypothetical protein